MSAAADDLTITRADLVRIMRLAEAAGRNQAAECTWPGDRALIGARARWGYLVDALGISPEELDPDQ